MDYLIDINIIDRIENKQRTKTLFLRVVEKIDVMIIIFGYLHVNELIRFLKVIVFYRVDKQND